MHYLIEIQNMDVIMFTKLLICSSQNFSKVKNLTQNHQKVSSISVFISVSLLLLLKLLKQTTTDFTMFNFVSYFTKNTKIFVFIVLSLLLSACGSSGSSNTKSTSGSAGTAPDKEVGDIPEVVEQVVISSHPATVVVSAGQEAIFTVVASGGGELTYQWIKDGSEIQGQTGSNLTLTNAELSNAGEYSVVVSNPEGSVLSLSALLSVNEVLASVELSWDIPVLREDGSDLEIYEINGYVIKYGTSSNNLDSFVNVNGAGDTSALIEELSSGTYYFSIATIDDNGIQGAYSAQLEQVVL